MSNRSLILLALFVFIIDGIMLLIPLVREDGSEPTDAVDQSIEPLDDINWSNIEFPDFPAGTTDHGFMLDVDQNGRLDVCTLTGNDLSCDLGACDKKSAGTIYKLDEATQRLTPTFTFTWGEPIDPNAYMLY